VVDLKGIYWLILIIALSWVLILVESYLFFAVIRPLGPPLYVAFKNQIESALLKITGTIALAVIWFAVMLSLRSLYIRSRASKKTPT
jgi:hypothetical protein